MLYTAFTDLEKAYDRVDKGALWDVLRMCSADGCLLQRTKVLYNESSACARVDSKISKSFLG